MLKIKSNPKKNPLNRFGWLIMTCLLLLATLLFLVARYKIANFGDAQIDEILFYIYNGLEGSNLSSFKRAVLDNSLLFIIIFIAIYLPTINSLRNRVWSFLTKLFRRKNPKELPITLQHKIIYASVLAVLSLGYLLNSLSFTSYIKAQFESNKIYETEYVDPSKVALEFPEQKRNLIYIYLESMENTVASKANGGSSDISYIPELESLVTDKSNISFSNTANPVGGGANLSGTSWTVGALTAQMGGIQLKNNIGVGGNDMGSFNYFLPGTYTIGEILQREGYNQVFMIGSDAAFGGRNKLFTQHGDFEIFDLNTAKATDKIADDYHVWWGYEDKKLFEYAKEEATKLAASDKPFNLQLLTVDTHFVDGYLDETCPAPYEQQYLSVHSCSSSQVYNFVQWVREQPFAANTTIVLSGDHLGMQTEFYQWLTSDNPDYQRTIYNVIINSAIAEIPDTIRYNRTFSTMDAYPTTLAAMGVKIPGERLGLGTNLFSGVPTLPEKYGLAQLDSELAKQSHYYNTHILIEND